jgi:excisionase family DNA binding protein
MTVTVRQAADRLEVSQSTVYGLIAAGKLRCARVGVGRGVIRIQEDQLAEYLEGATSRAYSPPVPVPRLKHLKINSGRTGLG